MKEQMNFRSTCLLNRFSYRCSKLQARELILTLRAFRLLILCLYKEGNFRIAKRANESLLHFDINFSS